MLSSSPSTTTNNITNSSTTDLLSNSPSKKTITVLPSSRSAFVPFSRSNISTIPITNNSSTLTTSTANNEAHQHNQGNNTTENPFTKYYSSQSALKLMTVGLALHKDFNKKIALTEPSIGIHNGGLDNADGNLIIYAGSILGERYYAKEMLGQGTFGQVVKCEDLTTKQIVAVKVVKNKPSYLRQARIEIAILDELARYGSNGSHHIITKLGEFNHQNHLCIVIEILGMNLFELIKQNRFKGLSLNVLSVFLSQLLDALCILSEANIIHCDLKPENILLTDLSHPKDLVRLIDFGSACHENEIGSFYIQSRFYRAPEVIFGLKYNKSIDMWSLGCICAELFLGLPLLPGVSQYNQVGRLIEMFGIPPPYMIEYGKYSAKYFKMLPPNRLSNPNDPELPLYQDGTPSMYELKTERQFLAENPNQVSMEWKRYFNYTKLPDLVKHYGDISKVDDREIRTRASFIDFLNGLLQLDPYKRWTADQAKMHPFVTGKEFVEPFIPPPTPQYLAHIQHLQQLHSSDRYAPQQGQNYANPQYYGSTPNQSFLPFGLSPVATGNFMGGSSLLGMSPGVANNSYPKPSSYVGSFDQQIPLGTSPYLKPGIPISGSHNNQMHVGSYGSSVGSFTYGSSFGSNVNLTFGVSPSVHNYPPQFYNGVYQASPSGSNLGVSPGAYSSSLLGTTPSAAGTPSGSRGRSSTLSGKNPHHHNANNNVDNLSYTMGEMTLEDGNNMNPPNITFSRERPRSFSSTKHNNGTPSSSWSNGRNNSNSGHPSKNNPYHHNNTSSTNITSNNNANVNNANNTNNPKTNKGYKNTPNSKHVRKGRSTDVEGENSDDNWNPFFPSDLDDDSASSTGFNPYYSKKNNSGGTSDYQGSPNGKGSNFAGSPPKQISNNSTKEFSPKNSYDDGSFSKPRHGSSVPQNTPNSGKKNFGNQQKKRANNNY